MTEKELLDYIKYIVGKREVPFDNLLNYLNEEGFDITEDELKGMLAKAGMLAPQVNDSTLMVRVKEGVEKLPPNQNPCYSNDIDELKNEQIKLPRDSNQNRNKN